MARMVFSGSFLDEMAELSAAAEAAVWEKLRLVEAFPGVGSSLIEPTLVRAFGERCLKVTAAGYDVLYERDGYGGTDEGVRVLGIVAQRRVR